MTRLTIAWLVLLMVAAVADYAKKSFESEEQRHALDAIERLTSDASSGRIQLLAEMKVNPWIARVVHKNSNAMAYVGAKGYGIGGRG